MNIKSFASNYNRKWMDEKTKTPFLKAFIMFGLIEELMKFSAGVFFSLKSQFQSKFD